MNPNYGWQKVCVQLAVATSLSISSYSKSAGKGSKHAWVESADNIGKVSYLGLQVFQHSRRRLFNIIDTSRGVSLNLPRYAHLPPHCFLTKIPSDSVKLLGETQIEISTEMFGVWRELETNTDLVAAAVRKLCGKKSLEDGDNDTEDSEEDN